MIEVTRQKLLDRLSDIQDEISALLIWPDRDKEPAGVKVRLTGLRAERRRVERRLEELPPIPHPPAQAVTQAGDLMGIAYPAS